MSDKLFFETSVHSRIPPAMATNETWMLHGRKAIPKSRPAALFRPDDFVPEPFGFQLGIPLYRDNQNWFALDVDYHGGDPSVFLTTLEIIKELPDFFLDVRWIYFLNRNELSGLHLVGLLPAPRLLEDIRRDVQKVLIYLG